MMDMMGNMTNRVMRPMMMATATSLKGICSLLLLVLHIVLLLHSTKVKLSSIFRIQYSNTSEGEITRIQGWNLQVLQVFELHILLLKLTRILIRIFK